MPFAHETRAGLLRVAGGCAALLTLLGLMVWLAPALVDDLDVTLGRPLAAWAERHQAVEQGARLLALATGYLPMTAVSLVVAGFLGRKGFRSTALWLLVVFHGSTLTMRVLKEVFGRERPDFALMQLSDKAFPSGHSSMAATASGIALVLAAVFLRRRNQRRLVAVAAVLWTLLLGLDRLLLGVHGLSDVLAGCALAGLWVAGAAYLVDPSPRLPLAHPLPSAVPRGRRLAVILNPIKVEDPAAFRLLVENRASDLGWDVPEWFETTVEDPGRSMAHAAALGGADLVVVCGGDGTVRTVCAELAGTGVPVGVVPAGTGNLLARNLDLPLYLNAAVDVALNGQDRAIDLVRVQGDGLPEDEHFLVMAGMGFDAAIMEAASDDIKAKVGWLAYVVSGLRHLMFPAIRVEVSVDGGPFERYRVRTVVIGNVGFLQAGLPLLPDATIDDGRIDVVMVNPRRFLSWLRVVYRVLGRRRRTDETLGRLTGRTVVVRASHDTPRQIDGDPVGMGKELACECLPGKLLVRVPR